MKVSDNDTNHDDEDVLQDYLNLLLLYLDDDDDDYDDYVEDYEEVDNDDNDLH